MKATKFGTTEQFAESRLIKPQTARVHLCRFGHYYGIRPKRLPNGRLAWPMDDAAAVEEGAQQ